jgi:hypothetical protein
MLLSSVTGHLSIGISLSSVFPNKAWLLSDLSTEGETRFYERHTIVAKATTYLATSHAEFSAINQQPW